MSQEDRARRDQPRDLKGRWAHSQDRCKDTIDMFPGVDLFGNDNPQPPRKPKKDTKNEEA